MTCKLSIYQPAIKLLEDSDEVEVCLALEQMYRNEYVLLHIVEPDTGLHVTGGNLMNIYPNGTFKLIGGVNFGGQTGFKERVDV